MSNEATANYERAIAAFRQVLANVSKEDLDKQSPCASWKVRDVVQHLVDGGDFFVTSAGSEAPGKATVADDNYQSAFDGASSEILAAFNQPGALDKMVDLPFGTMPAAALVGIATTDTFMHAWDIAKATGQSTDLDPEFAGEVLGRAQKMIPDEMRGADGAAMFGPKREAPDGAPAADQLAAFLGREV